jgi:hypothetical protein
MQERLRGAASHRWWRIELLLLIGCGNRPRRSRDGLDSTDLPGFARVPIRLRRRGGRVGRNRCAVRLSQEARHEACDLVLIDRSKPGIAPGG